MKKYLLLIVNVLLLMGLSAQKPSLTRAYNCFYDKDYDKAKEQIDLCTSDEKLSEKAQTWLYKGNIEFLLANREYSEKQKNENYQIRYSDAPNDAFDAFEKAVSINPKDRLRRRRAKPLFRRGRARQSLGPRSRRVRRPDGAARRTGARTDPRGGSPFGWTAVL